MFDIFINDAERALDDAIADIQSQAERMRALGMTNEQIVQRLQFELDGESAAFGSFRSAINKSFQDVTNGTAQMESNDAMKGVADNFEWILDPGAEHCESCIENSEKGPQTFEYWESIGTLEPGTRNAASIANAR